MPVTCSAHGCKNRAQAGSGLHFFRFPMKDQHKLELWVKAVCRTGFIPNKNSLLCHEHFKSSDFNENPDGSYKFTLKSDAVPSVFQQSSHSTLIPTKLFCNGPSLKKKKTDNPAAALFTISNETFQNVPQNRERITSRGITFESTMKKAALLCLDEHMSARTVAMSLNICHRDLCKYIRKLKLHRKTSSSLPSVGNQPHSKVFNDIQEKQLVECLKNVADMYFDLGFKELRQLAFEFAVKLKLIVPSSWTNNKKVSVMWMKHFLERNSSISIRLPDSRAMNLKINVKHFMDKFQLLLLEHKFEGQDIYSLDETGITTVQRTEKVVASAKHGTVVTMCLAVNAIGNYIPPMFVFPIVNYEGYFVRGGPSGCVGVANKSGSMQGNEFLKFMKHFAKHVKPSVDKKVLVLLDNHTSHIYLPVIDFCREVGIVLLSFPPNCSHKLQPLDQFVYGPFQQYIKICMTSWMTNNPGKKITIYDVPSISSNALINAATPRNIINGFSISGIWPFNRDVFTENEVAPAVVTNMVINTTTEQLVNTTIEEIVNKTTEELIKMIAKNLLNFVINESVD